MAVTSTSYTLTSRTLIAQGKADEGRDTNTFITNTNGTNALVLGSAKDTDYTLAASGTRDFYNLFVGDDLYADATYNADAVESVTTITIDATGGTWRLITRPGTVSELATTISATASAATVQAAARLLPGLAAVVVTGGPGDSGGTTPYVFTYTSACAGDASTLTVSANDAAGNPSLTGGAATAVRVYTTAGSDPTPKTCTVAVLQTGV